MSQSPILLKASQVSELLLSHDKDVEKMTKLSATAPADLEATRALFAGLNSRQWKVVVGCIRALGNAGEESAEVAVEALLTRLCHPFAEVRLEVAKSLTNLSQLAEIPLEPLGEAFLGEEEMQSFLALGRAMVSVLRTGCPVPSGWANNFPSLLKQIRELHLTELPLSGTIAERHQETIATQPPSTGLVARWLGRQRPPAIPLPAGPSPRPVRHEARRFLTDLGDRYRDVPEVISLLAKIYTYMPADPKARLSLVLDLCQMPLATFETSEALVILATGLVRDNRDKMTLLASMWGWGRSYDPTWTGRLALSAATARPDLRLTLFGFLWARQSRIDWNGWANSLRQATPFELEPLVAAALEAPEPDLQGWMRLLSQAPVEHIIPALARALGSSEKAVAGDALERLMLYGQSVPWLLNDIVSLRQHWSADPAMLRGLDTLMRNAIATDTPLPPGKREPNLIGEWTLEDSAANPFAHGEERNWRDGLPHLSAFHVSGQDLYLITSGLLVSFARDSAARVLALPEETAGAGMTLLAAGPTGDLLFAGGGRSQVYLYLLRPQSAAFRRLEPSISADDLPGPREMMTDGTGYGWAKVVERKSEVEGGLSLRKEVAYRVDPEEASLQTLWTDGMRPLETVVLETSDPILPPLGFHFSACGGYRICDSQPLAIRTGTENPIHSQGRFEGKLALHLEVFPSRLCRVYLWVAEHA
jgi:hypothetical protein